MTVIVRLTGAQHQAATTAYARRLVDEALARRRNGKPTRPRQGDMRAAVGDRLAEPDREQVRRLERALLPSMSAHEPELADDIAHLLARHEYGLPGAEIARRLHRRRANVLTVLRVDARFTRTGTGRGTRYRLRTRGPEPQGTHQEGARGDEGPESGTDARPTGATAQEPAGARAGTSPSAGIRRCPAGPQEATEQAAAEHEPAESDQDGAEAEPDTASATAEHERPSTNPRTPATRASTSAEPEPALAEKR